MTQLNIYPGEMTDYFEWMVGKRVRNANATIAMYHAHRTPYLAALLGSIRIKIN